MIWEIIKEIEEKFEKAFNEIEKKFKEEFDIDKILEEIKKETEKIKTEVAQGYSIECTYVKKGDEKPEVKCHYKAIRS